MFCCCCYFSVLCGTMHALLIFSVCDFSKKKKPAQKGIYTHNCNHFECWIEKWLKHMYARKTHVFGLSFGICVCVCYDCYWNVSISSCLLFRHIRRSNGLLMKFLCQRTQKFICRREKETKKKSVGKQIIIEQMTERLPPRRSKDD